MVNNHKTDLKTQFGTGPLKALLLTLPMLLLTAFMIIGSQAQQEKSSSLIAAAGVFLFINIVFYLMIFTGRTSRYRSILFVVYAVCFVVTFIANLIAVRGSMVLTEANMAQGETPFCHIVIPMVIIPAALTRTIIFPGSMLEGFASIGSMLVLWLGVTIALGRGWCSWGCFFGGLDEGFSNVMKKPALKTINKKWPYLPFAILLVVVLTSAAAMSPTYCEWLCPYKAVTEFAEITSTKVLFQTILFFSLFAGLVVLMPILTRKRTQCGLFCPMGAFQSLTNKLNVFDLKIDQTQCTQCGLCVKNCPMFALDEESVRKGQANITCSKCGKCVDICPQRAIFFHIKGTDVSGKNRKTRLLYIYPAFLLLAIMGSGMMMGAIQQVIQLVKTAGIFN